MDPYTLGLIAKPLSTKARKLMQNIEKGKDNINWATQSDGDLWEIFHRALKTKHTKAVKITWIKGHATTKMVEEGITINENMTGNRNADETADMFSELFTKEVMDPAQRYHTRYDRYKCFMQKVTTRIVEAYMIHRSLLEYYQGSEEAQTQQNGGTNNCVHSEYDSRWCPIT